MATQIRGDSQIMAATITNAEISASAAIAYSKLSLATSLVNADVAVAAAIAYSKLNLATSILNADVATAAAIAYSKLNLATSIVNADVSASAAIVSTKLASWSADRNGGGFKLTNMSDGTAATDAVTRQQLDSLSAGVDWKGSVRVATTAALPANTRTGNVLTASVNGALAAQDGITLVATDRILVKNEVTGANNGLYFVSDVGSGVTPFILTRSTDADASAEVTTGMAAWVEEGTTNGSSGWILTTTGAITLNTTSLSFTQFSGLGQITAGTGLTKTGNTLDVVSGNGGIVVNADNITFTLDGTTLAVGASGVKVNSSGITATEIATTVAGGGLLGGAGTALALDFVREAPAGTKNGTNTAFTITNGGMTSGALLYKNGLLLEPAGVDYTLSGTSITMVVAPISSDTLTAWIFKA